MKREVERNRFRKSQKEVGEEDTGSRRAAVVWELQRYGGRFSSSSGSYGADQTGEEDKGAHLPGFVGSSHWSLQRWLPRRYW